ncbi:hypothetical protein C2857_006969 [Epichloe festucae Fl1]|uniref:Cell wall protein n=1 Tax=Epichloe festucae (strain Fl1) TaxID=877507 RepID=A0A7S9KTR9_EPIFF|nr:hypothetical protein C2857_006969 [Epichloe festucae Fl1]
MKFSAAMLCFAAEALALSVFERDASAVTGVLDNVKSEVQKLDTAVKSGGNDPDALLKASNSLIQALKSGKTKVDGLSELALTDAVTLTTPVQDLTKVSQTLVEDLKSIRGNLEKQGLCEVVRTQTTSINDQSQNLIKAVVSKVPEEARDIANQLSAGLVKVLKQSQDDFSEQNCKNSGGAKPPGGGSSGSSSAAPASSGPASTTASAPASSGAPTTTAAATTTTCTTGSAHTGTGTGGLPVGPTGTSSPPVTAGAASFAPAGALALAVAALVM